MEDFKWEYKENMSKEDFDKVLEQHRNVVFAKGKSETQKEYETKLKEVEAKVNTYEEEKLFSSVKNDKQKEIIKNLMITDKYKDLSKEEAFKKVTEDYKDVFKIDEVKPETSNVIHEDIGTTLLNLHNGTQNPMQLEELKKKASTVGTKDPKEIEALISIVKAEALKGIK